MSSRGGMLDRNRKREYCDILGVPLDANEKIVKKAYHRLALELHPDRPQNRGRDGIDMKFKQVAEAYEHLSNGNHTLNNLKNSLKSEDIHSSLEHFFFTTKSHGTSLNNFKFSSVSASDFSGSGSGNFSSRFSNGNMDSKFAGSQESGVKIPPVLERKAPKKGQSLKTTLRVSFEEGVNGCTKILEFTRSVACKNCDATGIYNAKLNCRDCGGSGSVVSHINGATTLNKVCPTCSSETNQRCPFCNQIGKVTVKKTCTVEVPAGVVSGSTKVFHSQGDEGLHGGDSGDFIVCFETEEHPFFRREGDNACCSVEISFPQAALGTIVEVNTIYSKKLELQIEPGIQHGQVIKVKSEGFANESNGRGDFLIRILVITPKKLTKEEHDILQQLTTLPNFQNLNPIQK